jgi:kynurenine formamidase
MKFSKDELKARLEAYDWINERGYSSPYREVIVWTHKDARHDWVLVGGDWHDTWDEMECIAYAPTICCEAWDALDKDDIKISSLDDLMLAVSKSYERDCEEV